VKFVAAKCPSCQGELQVPDDKDFVKCMYCGVEVKIREAIKITLDGNIPNLMKLANDSLKSGNNEEAYNYYNKILEYDINNYEAWFGKAISASMVSTLANPRNQEMLNYFDNAIKHYDKNDVDNYKILISQKVLDFCASYFEVAKDHLNNFITVNNSWPEYLAQCLDLISVLEYASTNYNSKDTNIIKWIISICKDNLSVKIYHDDVLVGNSYRRVQMTKKVSEKHKVELQKKNKNAKDKWKKIIQDDLDKIKKNDLKNWENYDNWVKETSIIKSKNSKMLQIICLPSLIYLFVFVYFIAVSTDNSIKSVMGIIFIALVLISVLLYFFKFKKPIPNAQKEFKEFKELNQKAFKEFNQF
jgi:tetratricopeptide (TPR) repeat protein